LVLTHLPREQRAHEEVEERVAAVADAEVRGEDGHGLAVSADAGLVWGWDGGYCRTLPGSDCPASASAGAGPSPVRAASSPVRAASSLVRAASSLAPVVSSLVRAASISPTVRVVLASGRRLPRRSAATRRRRKMI